MATKQYVYLFVLPLSKHLININLPSQNSCQVKMYCSCFMYEKVRMAK